MAMAREQLLDDVMDVCRQTANRVMATMAAPEWIELNLSISQVKALFVLARAEPAAVGDIGECLGVGVSAASHLVDRLVNEGLVARHEDPDNRRRTLVCRTVHGRELSDRLQQGRVDRLRRLMARLTDDDLAALLRGMRALVAVTEDATSSRRG